jgi:hypothetical protein
MHPLSPAPLSPRHRDGALRPGQTCGGGVIPGLDAPGLRHAEGLRAAHQAARGGRQVMRPVVSAYRFPYKVLAYLIDSANPDQERLLGTTEDPGVQFGFSATRQRDIVFLLQPGVEYAYSVGEFLLKVWFTYKTVNNGPQAAALYTRIGLETKSRQIWTPGPITWNSKPSGCVPYAYNLINDSAGSNAADTPGPETILPDDEVAPTFTITPAWTQDVPTATYIPWLGYLKDSALPYLDGYFLMSAATSDRLYWTNPYGEQTHDSLLTVDCTFYGYEFTTEGTPGP